MSFHSIPWFGQNLIWDRCPYRLGRFLLFKSSIKHSGQQLHVESTHCRARNTAKIQHNCSYYVISSDLLFFHDTALSWRRLPTQKGFNLSQTCRKHISWQLWIDLYSVLLDRRFKANRTENIVQSCHRKPWVTGSSSTHWPFPPTEDLFKNAAVHKCNCEKHTWISPVIIQVAQ